MSYNNRRSLLIEIKGLFQRHKSNTMGLYDPERRYFTKNLIRELNNPPSFTDPKKKHRYLIISELESIFEELNTYR